MTPQQVKGQVEAALNGLRQLFVPEAELTFLMRLPDMPDAYMLITNDDLGAMVATLRMAACKEIRSGMPRRDLAGLCVVAAFNEVHDGNPCKLCGFGVPEVLEAEMDPAGGTPPSDAEVAQALANDRSEQCGRDDP